MGRAKIVIVGLFLSACNPTTAALVAGDPMGALDLAAGQGTVMQGQDGKIRFRYVFPEKHLDGLVPAEEQEEARLNYIAAFVGRSSICQSGWKIDSKSISSGHWFYEGSCNG
jgi:hypothetical protein